MPTQLVVSPSLKWSTDSADVRELRREGFHVVGFGEYRRSVIEPRRSPARRLELHASAEPPFERGSKVAFVGVPLKTIGDVRDVYGFILEPGFRHDWDIRVFSDRPLASLEDDLPIDPDLGFPWTVGRIGWIRDRYERQPRGVEGLPLTPIEETLFEAMREIGLRPRAQYGIGPYRADFAFPERQLCVEADGRAWHDAARDKARDERLREFGWTVYRFSGSAIFADPPECAATVKKVLAGLTPAIEYSDVADAPPRKVGWFKRLVQKLLGDSIAPEIAPLGVVDAADTLIASTEHPAISRDSEQSRAVVAHDGVVQVIAPAGSGKTTVIIERVAELAARGVPEQRILCSTFNRATREELGKKLTERGFPRVSVLNFHALGRKILQTEDELRGDIRTMSYGQWRRLCRLAKETTPDGVWIDAPDAQELVSNFKLAELVDPPDVADRAVTPLARTAARIYQLYEQELAEIEANDFDDLIFRAVQLLLRDDSARARWQREWTCVLVDEFQDIEPAQERLIQILAAPEDSLFVVGDEDQCIYTWRRAEVERIIDLDRAYPGLDRTVLAHNYRCPTSIVTAAKSLIEHNRNRFGKDMRHGPEAKPGSFERIDAKSSSVGVDQIASRIKGLDPDRTVVLARTSKSLREVALACLDADVPFRANERVLRPSNAERTVMAYLVVIANVALATEDDVRKVFDVPNRYLPANRAGEVLRQLQGGSSFAEAIDRLDGLEAFREKALVAAAPLLDELRQLPPVEFMARLRSAGGLDKHFGDHERLNIHDQVELDALDAISTLAKSERSLQELQLLLQERADRLANASSDEGVELCTIHGAKGREWDTVVLCGADQDLLPHARALDDAEDELGRQAIVEDERRLAYVALTRTRDTFVFQHTDRPSQFLFEAGLLPGTPPERAEDAPLAKTAAKAPGLTKSAGRTKGTPVAGGRSPGTIEARYQGTCMRCGGSIAVGEPIMMPPGSRKWAHANCDR